MRSWYQLAMMSALLVLCISPLSGEDLRSPTVGMTGRIDQIVLPGTSLFAKPLKDDRSPIVLRITATYPHGTAHRYDLEFYGLEPGSYDLRNYLKREDDSSTDDLPEIPVEIRGILRPGQVQPNALPLTDLPKLGGYRTLLVAAGAVWFVGLLALLLFRKSDTGSEIAEVDQKLSLADRLRPIVERAQNGELTKSEQAELERLLIGYWRKRLNLEGQSMTEALVRLRNHEEGGALLIELEKWLHSPLHGEGVDVAELLKPYENIRVEP